MNNFVADVVQEALVVRHNEERFLPSLKIVVQPNDCVQVETKGEINYLIDSVILKNALRKCSELYQILTGW